MPDELRHCILHHCTALSALPAGSGSIGQSLLENKAPIPLLDRSIDDRSRRRENKSWGAAKARARS